MYPQISTQFMTHLEAILRLHSSWQAKLLVFVHSFEFCHVTSNDFPETFVSWIKQTTSGSIHIIRYLSMQSWPYLEYQNTRQHSYLIMSFFNCFKRPRLFMLKHIKTKISGSNFLGKCLTNRQDGQFGYFPLDFSQINIPV